MTRERPNRRSTPRATDGLRPDASIAPFRLLQNPWRPLDVISLEDEDRSHEASMQILFEISDDTLALPYIAQVGPGGHHFDTEHTLARYSTAFYDPLVSSRLAYDAWQESGGEDAAQRAHRKWKQLLPTYQQPPLDPAIDQALREYVEKRKRE